MLGLLQMGSRAVEYQMYSYCLWLPLQLSTQNIGNMLFNLRCCFAWRSESFLAFWDRTLFGAGGRAYCSCDDPLQQQHHCSVILLQWRAEHAVCLGLLPHLFCGCLHWGHNDWQSCTPIWAGQSAHLHPDRPDCCWNCFSSWIWRAQGISGHQKWQEHWIRFLLLAETYWV